MSFLPRKTLMPLVGALLFSPALLLFASPVSVRFREGAEHGYLALRTQGGKIIASGDLVQVTHGDRVVTHLTFRFKDGSLDDETAVFTESQTFQLVSDRHIQRGRSFPHPLDMAINVPARQVTTRTSENGKTTVVAEHLDLPSDLSNGMILTLVKNIQADAKETTLSYVAAIPKPRIVKLLISPQGQDPFTVAAAHYQANHFLVKVNLGGITGMIAPIIGKQPADTNIWMAADKVPAFLKSEGPLTQDGPIWQIEMAIPVLH